MVPQLGVVVPRLVPGSCYLSDGVQLLQDGIFILLSEASCQQLIYLLQKEEQR